MSRSTLCRFMYVVLTGLVLSSNGISLNTQLAVKVNILWCVNFGVVKP